MHPTWCHSPTPHTELVQSGVTWTPDNQHQPTRLRNPRGGNSWTGLPCAPFAWLYPPVRADVVYLKFCLSGFSGLWRRTGSLGWARKGALSDLTYEMRIRHGLT